VKRKALRFFSGRDKEEREVAVSEDGTFHINVNGSLLTSVFVSPKNLNEFIYGFLASEGIANPDDIQKVTLANENITVETKNKEDLKFLTELRSSGCSGMLQVEPEPINSKTKFSSDVILNSLRHFDDSSKEWKSTGGTHSASLVSNDGKLLKSFEDIGRHNALDKVIGWALLNNQKLEDKFVLFTGRLSLGIVNKIARVGIPLVVSKAAPLSKAIDTADKLNVTLVGFARYPSFTVYTNRWRIE